MRFGQYVGRHPLWWLAPMLDNESGGAGGSGDGKTEDTGDKKDPPKDDDRKFSQADIDRIVSQRETRDKERVRKEVEAELRTKFEEEAKTNALKEQQEFKPLYEAEQQKAAKAEQDLKDREARERARVIQYEVKLAATKLNVVEPDDAYRLLDLTAVTLNDGGEPTNVEALLTELVKAKPYLVKSDTREGIPGTRRGGGADGESAGTRAQSFLDRKYAPQSAREGAAT